MTEEANYPIRKKNRLSGWDYSSHGIYFITICTHQHKQTLCQIVGDGFPVPKPAWSTAEYYIQQLPVKYPNVEVQKYVIMPNHVHLLIFLKKADTNHADSPTISNVIAWYKYQVTKKINESFGTTANRFFQRSFHDHIVRNEKDYQRIWEYIENNPMRWKEDCFFNTDV